MAGQLTLTNAPLLHGDCAWISFASTSLPVPLCPRSKTARLAPAAFSNFRRILPMTEEFPKITSSGGKLKSGDTSSPLVAVHPLDRAPNKSHPPHRIFPATKKFELAAL